MKQSTRSNLIFIAVVLAAAMALLFWQRSRTPSDAVMAQLSYNNNQDILDIPLDVEKTYDIDSNGYTIHIQVAEGRARFINSPCPDHKCEGFGWISVEDQQAVCMPAMAVLSIIPVA